MISTQSLELRAGARLLVSGVTVRINHGDRIGFVGRNGAGKSTLAKVLAGETMPAGGQVLRSGGIGYLPQDPRTGDEAGTVVERILSVRGLDLIVERMRQAEQAMTTAQGDELEAVMNRYTRADNEFSAAGGYSATAEAEAIATSLGIPERLFDEPLDSLSGGQRRRVELARILFSGAETLLLDEPTNHLDADSVIWLRDYLTKYSGGLVIISHDVNLIETVVNKVFYLDANRNVIDVYNMGWKKYLQQREADEHRRKIDRANAEKKAAILGNQGHNVLASLAFDGALAGDVDVPVPTQCQTDRTTRHVVDVARRTEQRDVGAHRLQNSACFLIIGRVLAERILADIVQGRWQYFRATVEHRDPTTLELAHVLGIEKQFPDIGRHRLCSKRSLDLGGIDPDGGVPPQPVHQILVARIQTGNLALNVGIHIFQVRQLRFVEFAQQAPFHLQARPARGWHHDVVSGLSGHQFGMQDLIVVKGVVAHLDACFLFKILNRVVGDVVRPVVDIENFFFLGDRRSGRKAHQPSDGQACHQFAQHRFSK